MCVAGDFLEGFWIHLDVDVLDDELMPAVDYRMKGGLTFVELGELLKVLLKSVMPLVWILLSSILILIKMARSQASSYPV